MVENAIHCGPIIAAAAAAAAAAAVVVVVVIVVVVDDDDDDDDDDDGGGGRIPANGRNYFILMVGWSKESFVWAHTGFSHVFLEV